MALPIEDYALIGDCQTAALVGKDGSIDWLCMPRFDSPAIFASLLGTPEHGRWRIAPVGEVQNVRRRYRNGTLILETDISTDDGEVRIIDWMPPRTSAPDVVRMIEGRHGSVPMRMELVIRCDYGSIVPWVRHIDRGIRAVAGPEAIYCRSDVPLRGEDLHTTADFTIVEGQHVAFTLTWCTPYEPQPRETNAAQSLAETESWWREWSGRCCYKGPWAEAVQRSLITLKALTYSPSGGLVAAATTSLPELIGGVRNWDYRICWLRDATFTLYALIGNGYLDEARAWRQWLVNAVAGMPAQAQIMYGLTGERRLTETVLNWLPGYENSSPVHVGNAAHLQHQLDVWGEVMDTLHVAHRSGLEPDENAWRVQRGMMKFLEQDWDLPDHGIWEMRGPQRQFTHSKVMAWVATDRAVRAVQQFGVSGDLERWRRLRDKIHAQICSEGFNTKRNSFVQYYGSEEADASLLMLPLVGFLPADDPRVLGTVDYIRRTLVRDGLVLRYLTHPDVDGLPPGEGYFLLCTYWLADNLALQGRRDEARDIFERLLELRNDVGLLSEQYDLDDRRFLGNFPQAFSHVGLINTARNLHEFQGPAEHRREGAAPPVEPK